MVRAPCADPRIRRVAGPFLRVPGRPLGVALGARPAGSAIRGPRRRARVDHSRAVARPFQREAVWSTSRRAGGARLRLGTRAVADPVAGAPGDAPRPPFRRHASAEGYDDRSRSGRTTSAIRRSGRARPGGRARPDRRPVRGLGDAQWLLASPQRLSPSTEPAGASCSARHADGGSSSARPLSARLSSRARESVPTRRCAPP